MDWKKVTNSIINEKKIEPVPQSKAKSKSQAKSMIPKSFKDD